MVSLTKVTPADDEGAHNHNVVLALCRKLGIVKVEIPFSGQGDSGAVCEDGDDTLIIEGLADPDKYTPGEVLLKVKEDKLVGGTWTTQALFGQPAGTLHELFTQFAYSMLEDCPFDFVNNEGGSGTFTLKPFEDNGKGQPLGTVELEAYANVTARRHFNMKLGGEDGSGEWNSEAGLDTY